MSRAANSRLILGLHWGGGLRPAAPLVGHIPLLEKLPFIRTVLSTEPDPSFHEPTISDRRYSDEEFALILRKAGELQQVPGDERTVGLTLSEMKSVAREVGIDPALIERAASLVPHGTAASGFERLIGGPVKYRMEQSVSRELTEDQVARLVPEIRDAAETFGVIEEDPSGLAWRSGAEPGQIWVTATREGEETRVRVTADRTGSLILTVFGTGMVGMIATLLTGAIVDPDSVVVGVAIVGTGVAGGLTAARTLWAATTRSMRRKLDTIMGSVTSTMEEDG